MASDLDFQPPGPGFWVLDTGHLTTPCSGYHQALFRDWFVLAFKEDLKRWGSLLESLDWEWIHGFPYYRLRFVGAPVDATEAPTREQWDAAAASHPEIVARLAAATESMTGKRWREWHARWNTVDKPLAVANHRALLAVEPRDLDDHALLAYLARCTRSVEEGLWLHHIYNMAAWIPVGDLVAHVTAWTERSESDAFRLLGGASPDALGGEAALERLVHAIRADDEAKARLDRVYADPAGTLAWLRSAPGEVGAATRDYVDLVAYRPVNGEDVGDTCAFELPDLVVGGIRAAVATGVRENVAESEEAAALAAEIRSEVPEEHRAMFDELLAEARLVYGLREERAALGDQWALGIARRGLLAAGERLVARGRLEAPEHLVEATWPEVQAVLRDDEGAPSAAELAARAHFRATASFDDAPPTLGPPPAPPLPLEWLPELPRRLEIALLTVIGALFGGAAPPATATTVSGVGVSPGTVEGPARIVGSSSEFGRIRHGDVLVTRSTTTAFNIVLPLVAGIVTDNGGLLCHAAIVSREYGIPAVVGTGEATKRIADGQRVRVDGTTGVVTLLEG